MDWTVKLDAIELDAGKTYYYRFLCLGRTSPIGRTKTAAAEGLERLRIGVVSCSSYQHGYFHSYRQLATMPDLDLVLHLGDYIYEYAPGDYGTVRAHEPANEIVSLSDYRTRYGQYRADADLQAVHRQHPFIVTWDDHETADNSWIGGAGNHNPATEGPWEDRLGVARQAYLEWMPIREFEGGRIYRGFSFGGLVDLMMLDTRIEGRDEQAPTGDREAHADPSRSLLGETQHAWLADQLGRSTATWKLLGQQVMFAQWKLVGTAIEVGPGQILNADGWDGYEASRNRILDQIEQDGIDNVVVLTGDIHSSWVFDVTRDPANPDAYDPQTGEGSLAVEYVCTAVTSPAIDLPGASEALIGVLQGQNPHLKYGNFEKRGYLILDITPAQAHASVWLFDDIEEPEDIAPTLAASYATLAGENTAREAAEVQAPTDAPELAP
jgi:alkaline phosphatase D